jgi:histidinol-phosphate aminotransferase
MSGLVPRPGILDIAPYEPGRARTGQGGRVVKLSSNESAFGASPAAQAAYEALAPALHRYPDGGSSALRAALAARYGLDAARIVCGCGSDDILQLMCRAYVGPGDEVIYSRHSFSIYGIAAHSVGARCVITEEEDYTPSVDATLAALSARTRLVFLANPGNPSGTYLSGAELRRLHAGLPDHVALVLDGAYAEFVTAPDYEAGARLAGEAGNVVMARTFSKIYGLAGLRLGWAYGSAGIIDVLNRLRGPFNVSSAAQVAGLAALEDEDFVARVREHTSQWRAWLRDELVALGLFVAPSVTNFLLLRFPAEPGLSAAEADAFLTARGILLRRMEGYGLPDHLRLTVGTAEENHMVVDSLRDFLRAGRKG